MIKKSRVYLLTCIYFVYIYYTSNLTFLIHAYMCTLAIIRMFIVTLLKIINFRSLNSKRLTIALTFTRRSRLLVIPIYPCASRVRNNHEYYHYITIDNYIIITERNDESVTITKFLLMQLAITSKRSN